MVIISRIRGDVDVRYVRCVSELKRGRDDVVSNAKNIKEIPINFV